MAENPQQVFKPFRLLHTLPHSSHGKARRVQFSPDGLLLAVASDFTPRTYNIWTPTPIVVRAFKGHAGCVTDLAFTSDSRFLATSSNDTTIRLWNVYLGSLVRTLTGHNGLVSCVKFNRESNMIASGSFDETVRIWDVNSGACKMVIPIFSGRITGVDFNPAGSMIAACSLRGLCGIWDPATGNGMATIKGVKIPPVGSVKFSSDGKFLLLGDMDNSLRIWSTDGGILHTVYVGHMNTTGLSTFLGADERYIMSGSGNCLYIWEFLSRRMVEKVEAHTGPVLSVSCHPSRNMIATASLEDMHTVKIWTQEY